MPSIKTQVGFGRFAPHAGLLALLLAEILFLTIAFDAQNLDRVSAYWGPALLWTPQYLRVAITAVVLALMISGRDMGAAIKAGEPDRARFRFRYIAAQLCVFGVFAWTTAILMGSDFSSSPIQGRWALMWVCLGAATLATWGLAVLPIDTWSVVLRRGRTGLWWGLVVGVVAWTGAFLSQDAWGPLSRYTFNVVVWILRWSYVDAVSDPATLLIGTPTFLVDIAPECSGYEGIGLIVSFLSVYLWFSRDQLRFPHAFILLPIGAAAIWILNAVRIAALIAIGASGWPEVALGGFHSQVGWLSFNAVGLLLVAISIRGRYFAKSRPVEADVVDAGDSTTAYLAPFLAIVAASMLTGAFSSGFDWLYPVRVLAAAAALWAFREHYTDLRWRWSWGAIAIGALAFVIWLALMPAGSINNEGWPGALSGVPPGRAALWLAVRVLGYVIAVPLAEELAFRGFLMRRLLRVDFFNLPVAAFSWLPFLVSSFLFGALHGQFWLAGTIAGMLFGVALYRGNAVGDAVQAHATTNGLMVLYVFATGHWSAWS